MIKRTEFRALRFLQNIENYHSISLVNGWTISDFTDIYPLGAATHNDCGYTWSITTASGFNLVHGSNSSPYYRDCYLLFNLSTGESEIYFKIDPTDKAAVTVAGIDTDSSIATPEAFDNTDVDFATLLHFTDCGSDCVQTVSINVIFPTDTEASDIVLTYTGGSDTTSYGTASAMATYFKNYFAALGFKATSSGGSLWVIFNPEIGFNPTNGYNILDSVVFTVQGAEPPYPYKLDIEYRYGEICCDDFCNQLPIPYGSRMSGFGLHEGVWYYENEATLSYAECDCGTELLKVSGTVEAIPLMTGKTVILHDFTMDLQGKSQFEFYLWSHTDVGVENINRITENNEYGFGTANFGKFSGTSGDSAIGITSYGWTTTANDGFLGHNQIKNNGLGSSCPGAGFDAKIWTIDMITNPNIQRYTIEIYFYAKDVMPTNQILTVYVDHDVVALTAIGSAVVSAYNTIYAATASITVPAGVQTVTIGLALCNGYGDFIASTGANDFVTVFANVRRAYLSDVNYLVGHSQSFSACKSCYNMQFEHENTGLENGFPGHLVGGWDIAFPVELQKISQKLTRDDTVYITSRGNHIELSSMTDKEEQYAIVQPLTDSQAEFLSLAFGLTPFTLDSVGYAESAPMEMDYQKIDKSTVAKVVLVRDGWNKNRSLC